MWTTLLMWQSLFQLFLLLHLHFLWVGKDDLISDVAHWCYSIPDTSKQRKALIHMVMIGCLSQLMFEYENMRLIIAIICFLSWFAGKITSHGLSTKKNVEVKKWQA